MNHHNIEREVKLNAILDKLAEGDYDVYKNPDPRHPEDMRHRITRQTLKFLIIQAIHEANRGTLSKWINELLALHIIDLNPTTQTWNNSSIIMPHDSTMYYINFSKLDRHTLSNSNTLNRLSTLNVCTLKEQRGETVRKESARTEHQTEIKSNSSPSEA